MNFRWHGWTLASLVLAFVAVNAAASPMDQPGGQRPTLSGTVQRPGGDGAPPSGQMPQITLTPGTLQSGQMPQISMTPGTLSGSMFAITPAGLLTNVATGAGQGQTPRRTRTAQAPDSSA